VTNNLDRELQKAQARYMREGYTNSCLTADPLNGSRPEAKSLFRNILRTSPCGSRFCADPHPILTPQVIQNQYFRKLDEKMWPDQLRVKSLSWNILPASPCNSIFYSGSTLSPPSKLLRMNILE
jgi:hypothetical protein